MCRGGAMEEELYGEEGRGTKGETEGGGSQAAGSARVRLREERPKAVRIFFGEIRVLSEHAHAWRGHWLQNDVSDVF